MELADLHIAATDDQLTDARGVLLRRGPPRNRCLSTPILEAPPRPSPTHSPLISEEPAILTASVHSNSPRAERTRVTSALSWSLCLDGAYHQTRAIATSDHMSPHQNM